MEKSKEGLFHPEFPPPEQDQAEEGEGYIGRVSPVDLPSPGKLNESRQTPEPAVVHALAEGTG